MVLVSTILGIFGNSGDVYKDDMSVEHFRNNYDTIVDDLKKGNRLGDVMKAFADVAPEYPEAVIENGSTIYKNYDSDDPNVQINTMTALVRADLAVDDDFLGQDSIDTLNMLLEHDNPDVQESIADLLAYGVSHKGYYVYGNYIKSALLSENSLVARARAAQALRMYLDRTEDYNQLEPCIKAIGKGLDSAFENLDNEWWREIAKELLALTYHVLKVQPQTAEHTTPFLKKAMDTMDKELMQNAMRAISYLPEVNKEAFEGGEPIVGSLLSNNAPDGLKKQAIVSYYNYLSNDGDTSIVEDRISGIIQNYKSLESSEDDKRYRYFTLKIIKDIMRDEPDDYDVLRDIELFEREIKERGLEDLDNKMDYNAVMSTFSLYMIAADNIGVEVLRGHVQSVPKYMESKHPEIRECAATVLMDLVDDNMDELERTGADIERIKEVIRKESDNIDNVDRVFKDVQSSNEEDDEKKSSEDIEDEYLTKNPDVNFNDYIGMEELKREAEKKIIEPLENPELHDEFGVDIQRGFLFHGLPGTGKTYFAKALAGEFNLSYMEIDAADLTSKWIGEGAKNVSEMFNIATDNEPCLVFIDEIDAIASDRSGVQQTKSERQMVNQLLQSVSRINDNKDKVVVVAATNRIDDVDSAVLRTGRLGTKIKFTKPKPKTRVKIFRQHCKPDTSQLSNKWLMDETDGMVQSDMEELSNRASYNALDRYKKHGGDKIIERKDVEKGLEKMRG